MVPNLHKEIFLPILSTSIAVIMIVQIGTKMNGFESLSLSIRLHILLCCAAERDSTSAQTYNDCSNSECFV